MFFTGIIIVLIFVMIAITHCLFIGNQYEKSYNAGLLDKLKRASELERKKIILVGDSNVSFGIDSSVIEQKTGYRVINLGLYRSLGNNFAEACSIPYIGDGDIVVILHSSYSDNGRMIDYSIGWLTCEYHREIWDIVDPIDYVAMLKAYPAYIKSSLFMYYQGGFEPGDSSYSHLLFLLEIISNYTDYIFKPNLFYNSILHLNKEGTKIRTDLLIDDLERSGVFLQ